MQTLAESTSTLSGDLRTFVQELLVQSSRALARMYRPERKLYAFRVRLNGENVILEGISRRYTSIVLIGLAEQSELVVQESLPDSSPRGLLDHMGAEVHRWDNLGDTALLLWAAKRWRHLAAEKAMRRLVQLDPTHGRHPTVELAWALMALSLSEGKPDLTLATPLAERLMHNFNDTSRLFPHYPDGMQRSLFRSHVTCFADWVYPVLALSQYQGQIRRKDILEQLNECAARVCALQGPEGQWWWHYDVRTGQVLDGYPVYAVHQNSMGPMALFALHESGGDDHRDAIRNSLRWLQYSPEIGDSLVDHRRGFIWRKVARKEPGKLARGLQALASTVHRSLRFPGIETLFPPTWVDYECRPYHLGWILYTWSSTRLAAMDDKASR